MHISEAAPKFTGHRTYMVVQYHCMPNRFLTRLKALSMRSSQDERTCREFDFPVIMSGHDHHRVDRVVEGTRLLKPGMDAHYAIVMVRVI